MFGYSRTRCDENNIFSYNALGLNGIKLCNCFLFGFKQLHHPSN